MKRLLSVVFLAIIAIQVQAEPIVEIQTNFPGGNAVITKNMGSEVHIEPDLRGDRPWFYWLIEARAVRAGKVNFVLPEKVIGFKNGAIGFQGPAISRDLGKSWNWMGRESVNENRFSLEFTKPGETIQLGVTIPYTTADLQSFLSEHRSNPHLKTGILTKSKNDRPVELIQIGKRGPGKKPILITGRHHASETMASFAVEGMLAEAMSEESEFGKTFRERHVLFCVPIVDKDGVEAGDQGKNRRPHDHNRDYTDAPIYPEVAAIQKLHQTEQFVYALDVHCPTLVMDIHQVMYFVGAKIHPPKNQEKVSAFAKEIDQRLPPEAPHGPLVWLRDEVRISPKNSRWFAFQKSMIMSATLEIPFAPKGKAASPANYREYGRGILKAFVSTPFEEIGPPQTGDFNLPKGQKK